ncbi:hypothetical protein [Nonomuraea sp. B19D2]|uniref:hypothetical protein n=1 Tax=Nonomuraea sp. B19D2 TaxID=3159561 RepID=UPI0032DA294C
MSSTKWTDRSRDGAGDAAGGEVVVAAVHGRGALATALEPEPAAALPPTRTAWTL